MRRAVVGVAVVGLSLCAGLQVAGADSKRITDSDADGSPDSVDIVAAKAGHKGKRLVHTLTADAAFNEAGAEQVLLQFNLSGGTDDCEREFIFPPAGNEVPMIRCGIGESNKTGKIALPAPNKMRISFKANVLGSPKRYGWRVITREGNGGSALIDAAPDLDDEAPVYVRHKLG